MMVGQNKSPTRFAALAESYGGNLERWPQEDREWARGMLEISAEAQRVLADAAAADELLVSVSAEEDARLWPEGGHEAALARLRSGVAGRIADVDRRRAFWRPGSPILVGPSGGGALVSPVGNAAVFGLAAAAGLWVGWLQGAAAMPQPAGLMTFLLSGPFQGIGW